MLEQRTENSPEAGDPDSGEKSTLTSEDLRAPHLDPDGLLDDSPLGGRKDSLLDNSRVGTQVEEELSGETTPSEVSPDTFDNHPFPEIDASPFLAEAEAEAAQESPGPGILERDNLYQHLVAPLDIDGPEDDRAISLDEQSVDALMAELEQAHRLPPAVSPAPAPSNPMSEQPPPSSGSLSTPPPSTDSDALSQDMLDAIIAAATTEEAVGSENLVAAAMTPAPDFEALTQNDLDHIIERAKELGLEIKELETALPATAPESSPKRESRLRRTFRPRNPIKGILKELPRLGASLGFGLAVAVGVYAYLSMGSGTGLLTGEAGTDQKQIATLADAIQQAQVHLDRSEYARAIELLTFYLQEEPDSPLQRDASYMLLEARIRGFVFQEDSPEYMQLLGDIDALISKDPRHARAPEALQWKADLYELDNLDVAALQTYDTIIGNFPDYARRDLALRNAARLSISANRPAEAAEYAQMLLNEYPGSPLAGEARLQLAKTYEMAGMVSDARTLYVRMAEQAGNTPLGNQALLNLGKLYSDRDEFEQAIQVLEQLLSTTTTTEGSDEAYLHLARAYRQTGNFEQAVNTLNDLLNFLPESDITPAAYVELSQLRDLGGDRREALRIAEQAAVRFPGDPEVLKNKGVLLGLSGNAFGAGATLMAAEEAGAHEPALLLAAARHFYSAGESTLSQEAFSRLQVFYPGTPEAFTGGIEEAKMLQQIGQPSEAVEKLETLTLSAAGTPHHVDSLLALAEIYNTLGLAPKVSDLARQISSETQDAGVLARTALALLDSGRTEEGMAIVDRIDVTSLDDALEYQVGMQTGKALLAIDPSRGLERMEGAYYQFPGERTEADEQYLLEAYLKADRTAAARRIISELEARVKLEPVHAPVLIDAAMQWGDHLYAKEDFRAAADAYALAADTATQTTPPTRGAKRDYRWSLFQRANALLQLSDFEDSLKLFDEVADSDAPWADDAKIKADFARLEQRRRGFPVNTPPVEN